MALSLKEILAKQKEKQNAGAGMAAISAVSSPAPVDSAKAAGDKREAEPVRNGVGSAVPSKTGGLASILAKQKVAAQPVQVQKSQPGVSDPLADFVISDVAASTVSAEEYQHASQPDELSDEQVVELRRALHQLSQSLDDPTTVGQTTQYIIGLIQDKPELRDNLAPADLGLMVRGLRAGYGVAISKKSERTEKRTKNSQAVNDVMNLLGNMNISL